MLLVQLSVRCILIRYSSREYIMELSILVHTRLTCLFCLLLEGPTAAKSFIHDQFLSRDVNVSAIFEKNIVNPKRDLSYLMRRYSQEPPISRCG